MDFKYDEYIRHHMITPPPAYQLVNAPYQEARRKSILRIIIKNQDAHQLRTKTPALEEKKPPPHSHLVCVYSRANRPATPTTPAARAPLTVWPETAAFPLEVAVPEPVGVPVAEMVPFDPAPADADVAAVAEARTTDPADPVWTMPIIWVEVPEVVVLRLMATVDEPDVHQLVGTAPALQLAEAWPSHSRVAPLSGQCSQSSTVDQFLVASELVAELNRDSTELVRVSTSDMSDDAAVTCVCVEMNDPTSRAEETETRAARARTWYCIVNVEGTSYQSRIKVRRYISRENGVFV